MAAVGSPEIRLQKAASYTFTQLSGRELDRKWDDLLLPRYADINHGKL